MKRRALGQHTLMAREALQRMVEACQLKGDEVVFEAGTGIGNLTKELAKRAKRVISYELDPLLVERARWEMRGMSGVEVIEGDAFTYEGPFDVFVANIPFSQSRRFIEWLVIRCPPKAVATVQREFSKKLLAKPCDREYRAVSAMARYAYIIEPLLDLSPQDFDPPPKVGASVLRFTKRAGPLDETIVRFIKLLFSFRGKVVKSALRELGFALGPDSEGLLRRRVESLSPDEVVLLARACLNSKLHEA